MTNSLYNEDELHAPEWLDQQFFEKVLQRAHKENVKLQDYSITPGTTKSDHYASLMFRAKINYICCGEKRTQSLIIKTNPIVEGKKKESTSEMNVFATEIKMYTETLPQIERILQAHGDNTKLCAKLYYHSLEAPQCMIFEDLVEEGYAAVAKRFCNMTEVKAALVKLAKLHAVSYKLGKQGDASILAFRNGSFSSPNVEKFYFIKNAVKRFKHIISQQPDLRNYVPHVEKVEASILRECIAYFNAYANGKRDGIFVLNHGDFHMKNMMVKNVAGQLKDVFLVDYQMSFYGSPAIDLIYSIFMLLSPEMRRDSRDELIYYYFINFQATLKLISFDGDMPTLTDLHDELRQHKHWELYLFMSFLMFNYVFASENGDLAKAVEDSNYCKQLYEDPRLLKELHIFLPKYVYQGYFDI